MSERFSIAGWGDAVSAAIEAARAEAIEEAAMIAQSYATCGCNGAHGRCNTDDYPLAIAKAIRALQSQTAEQSP
ncbi:MAG: hypothetical protein KGL39_25175 [Patescibacteria group bacterium]|nr:hypothetical protein [Patescibacteria group bacterium]